MRTVDHLLNALPAVQREPGAVHAPATFPDHHLGCCLHPAHPGDCEVRRFRATAMRSVTR